MMAVALAQKLCEAAENEDAREVENLLCHGADPNLVLPNGIAAIHLASGKESESALRCLALILQHGGNPNVRSIEELTPVHVAASWGCCKALICLLRRGGDPNLQDQDGNTALDLALLEKNRRCVVALQEYKRNAFPDKMHGYLINDSFLPDEFPEMSSITLIDSICEMPPICSTKISPFISEFKNGTTAKVVKGAILTSRLEQAKSRTLSGQNKCEKDAGLDRSELLQNENDIIPNNYSKLKVDYSSVVCSTLAPDKEDYSSFWHTNSTNQESIPTEINEHLAESTNTHTCVGPNTLEDKNSGSQAKEITIIADPTNWKNMAVNSIRKNNAELMLNYSRALTQLEVLQKWEGIDVTSPDHVYTYDREHSNDDWEHSNDDFENTLVFPGSVKLPSGEVLEEPAESSGGQYTSCSSEGFATVVEYINTDQICSQNSGVAVLSSSDVFNILNEQDSMPGIVHTLQEGDENHDHKDCSSTSTQLLNPYFGVAKVVTDDHEIKIASDTEICASPSLTLPIDTTNSYKSRSQDLRARLRNMMLSTKNCRTSVKSENCSMLYSGPEGRSFCSGALPVSKITVPVGPELKDVSISCSNTSVDTFVLKSPETKLKEGLNPELHDVFKKMMLATKDIDPSTVLNEERNQCYFTPRAKNRVLSFQSRHSNSSLFEESVEMPGRGRRVRSPNSNYGSPQPSVAAKLKENISPSCKSVRANHISTVQPVMSSMENAAESDSTISISNFLTDDLSSSETEAKCSLLVKKTSEDPCFESRISESLWLTEETESSGEIDHKYAIAGSAPIQNGILLHSTLIEDAAVNSKKGLNCSFSRLSCVPKANETEMKPCLPTTNPLSEKVPLSPGGRPINVSHCEPIEYLYMDNDKGHTLIERHMPCSNQSSSNILGISDDTILYDWRNYRSCKLKINKDSPSLTPNQVAVELYRLSNNEIARRLRELGEDPGQVTSKTRRVCIFLLDKLLKEQATSNPGGISFDYSAELSLALRTYDIPDCKTDEADLSREFDQPDKTRKWREGVLKSSFNYLLLDPRVTRNLPTRCHTMSLSDCFRTFVHAVFYVGKGKRARPYCHLYEALVYYKGSNKTPCSKIQQIVDIWKSCQGVLSLHCFQNTIPVEAYTREACMVDAIGLKMLTNQKKGVYYGQAQNWTPTRRRRLGVHMLHRAMQIFLAEGERQLRPPDIGAGK